MTNWNWEHDDAVRSHTRRARVVEVNDKGSQQRVDLKGLKNEKPKKIWRPQGFGYTSVPPKDSDGVMIQMGGRSDRTLYQDGGHEKYRPKKTPEGCSALFNMHGDIIRVFKDNADVVHQKKVNIRIGHGYKAGDSGENGEGGSSESGDDSPDDQQSEDTKTISIKLEDGESIELEYDGSKVTIDADGKITALAGDTFSGGIAGMWVTVHGGKVHLGVASAGGTAPNKVMTEAGASSKVYAVI